MNRSYFCKKNVPNTYFQFRQFRVEQDRCAMKVCTDACIQGALAGREVKTKKSSKVLDIGTGTGLLSLMLAQKRKFQSQHAIEINEAAAEQARQNVEVSPFRDQIRIFRGDIRTFPFRQEYDFIISNPPFYEKALKSPSALKNQAMHSSHLDYVTLIDRIVTLLTPKGITCIMVPYVFSDAMLIEAALKGLYPYKIWEIRQTPGHTNFRSILFLNREPGAPVKRSMVIKDRNGRYSPEFQKLLQPYYIHLG